MNHVARDDLVLYHYGEIERDAIDRHLSACETCRADYARLQGVLELASQAPVPERSERYEQQLWQRIEGRLERRGRLLPAIWPAPRSWAMAGTVLALVALAFLAGRYFRTDPLPGPIPGTVRERILLVAIGEHLDRSQRLLIELSNADSTDELDLGAEQRRAGELASTNRLYRQSVAPTDDPVLAEILDQLERTLIEVANGPSRVSDAELTRLQQRIERRGILFKIRVLGNPGNRNETTNRNLPSGV